MCDTEASTMHGKLGTRTWFAAVSAVFSVLLAPSIASAGPASHTTAKPERTARIAAKGSTCTKPEIEVVSGKETGTFSLAACDGGAVATSLDKLTALARPNGAPKKEPAKEAPAPAKPATETRLDSRLAERLELVVDHFRKDDDPVKVILVPESGKARSTGSYHSSGRAIDFHLDGIENDEVEAFCKTLPDTGCGFYPTMGFVHLDVRDPGAGHVSWIDVSKSGEAPKYVSSWSKPEAPKAETAKTETAKVEAAKAETAPAKPAEKQAANGDGKLPALPAAAAVAPLETPKPAPAAAPAPAPAPAAAPAKHHRHHRHHHAVPAASDRSI